MKEKIYAFVASRGPVIGKDVTKHFNIDSTYSGAYLSELVGDKRILYTHEKFGQSPLYYIPEQAPKIAILYEQLNDKDKETFNLLKEKKVLRDIGLPTITRVSLRNIKDFSIPLNVNIDGKKEIFWKWYLTDSQSAEMEIKRILDNIGDKPAVNHDPRENSVKEAVPTPKEDGKDGAQAGIIRQENETESHKEQKFIELFEKQGKKYEHEMRLQRQLIDDLHNRLMLLEKQKSQSSQTTLPQNTGRFDELNRELEDLREAKLSLEKTKVELEMKLSQKYDDEPKKNIEEETDEFIILINKYFTDKKIEVHNYNIIKKGQEAEFLIKIPSVIGMTDFYCRAKNKKKCNEGDISTSFAIGQVKKLPVLFISPGDLTKKGYEMIEKEFKNQLKYQKLE